MAGRTRSAPSSAPSATAATASGVVAGQREGATFGRPVSARAAAPAARRSTSGRTARRPPAAVPSPTSTTSGAATRPTPGTRCTSSTAPVAPRLDSAAPRRSRATCGPGRGRRPATAPASGPDDGEHQGVGLDVDSGNGRTRSASSRQAVLRSRWATRVLAEPTVRITTGRCRYGEPHDRPRPADLTPARAPRRPRRQDGRLRGLGDADRVPRRRGRRASTPPSASGSACSTSATWARPSVTGAGRGGVRQRLPDQRPRADLRRPGAVHDVLRRDRRRGRRPHRLPHAPTTTCFLIPNAANTAEVVRRLQAAAPEGVEVTDLHQQYGVLAVQGPRSDEVLQALGLPDRPRLHVVRRGRLAGPPGHRVPHRLHRRARLRAACRAGTTRRPCGTR